MNPITTALTGASLLELVGKVKCAAKSHSLAYLDLVAKNPCHRVYQCTRCKLMFVDSRLFVHEKRSVSRNGCTVTTHCDVCNQDVHVAQDCQGPWHYAGPANTTDITRFETCKCGNTQPRMNPDFQPPPSPPSQDDDDRDDGLTQMMDAVL